MSFLGLVYQLTNSWFIDISMHLSLGLDLFISHSLLVSFHLFLLIYIPSSLPGYTSLDSMHTFGPKQEDDSIRQSSLVVYL